MMEDDSLVRLTPRLVNALYTEALLQVDEARAYFESGRMEGACAPAPPVRVALACESLKVTTRLMHVIAWLMTQRAAEGGESGVRGTAIEKRPLGKAGPTSEAQLALLPEQAGQIIRASMDLYERVRRIDEGEQAWTPALPPASPARSLLRRLSAAY